MNSLKNVSAATKTNSAVKTETSPKTEAIKTQPPVIKIDASNSLNSLDEKFLKLDTLFALQEKYIKLDAAIKKLRKFKIGNSGDFNNITLRDDEGERFDTGNPTVIKKVIDWLLEDLTQKLQDTAAKINF